jgi:hypothetical protein
MKILWIAVLAIGAGAILYVSDGLRAQIMRPDEALARSVVADLKAKKFDAVVAHFGEPIKNMMSAATLGKMWDTVTKNYGEFQSIESVESEEGPDHDTVLVGCKVQKAVVTVILKIDKKHMVTDLRISFPMAPAS